MIFGLNLKVGGLFSIRTNMILMKQKIGMRRDTWKKRIENSKGNY